MKEQESVFARLIHHGLDPVTLTKADLILLNDVVGDALEKADEEYNRWRSLFEEYDGAKGTE